MLTQCPSCQTTFRVTSEILRVAHGQVRCGRCHTQFDALERLIEEGPTGEDTGRFLKPPRPSRAPPGSPQIEVDEPDAQEDITLEGRHIEISGTYRVLEEDDSGQRRVRQEVTEEWVEIDDVGDSDEEVDEDSQQGVEFVVEEEQEESATQDDAFEAQDEAIDDEPPPQRTFAPPPPAAPSRRRLLSRETPAADMDLLTPKRQRARDPLIWKVLAVPLVLLMIVQVIHHYRSDLVRHPRMGAPLMSIYGALRLPLTPDWDLHAYEIKQWGVLADAAAPGTLKVRASITNRAEFAQPYPLLKLVLEDRWGDQVRAREFDPSEYADPGVTVERLLAPQQQTNATIVIVDPGADAEGFRFDVCLRGRSGPVCAAEIPR